MAKNGKLTKLLVAGLLSATMLGTTALAGCNDEGKKDNGLLSMQDVYAKAQELGFEGTLEELIAMFKGDKGDTGAQGEKGEKGDKGDKGDDYVITETDKNDIANLVLANFVDVSEVGQ